MKKWRKFLECPVPPDMEEGFTSLLAQNVWRIGRIFAPAIILFQLGNVLRLFIGEDKGLGTTPRKVYFALYLILLFITVGVALNLLPLRRKGGANANKHIVRLSVIYAAFICIWGLCVTLYDQRATENVTVYASIIISIAVLLYLKPYQAIAIFGGCQILLMIFINTFRETPTNHFGNYVNTSALAIMAAAISISRYLGKARDYQNTVTIKRQASEILRINRSLSVQIFLDELSQLQNRRYLEELLPRRWKAARETEKPVGLLMLDIDDFKQYNDTCGHQAGDDCIRKISDSLRRCTYPEKDCLLRYGGEEFLAVLFDRSPSETRTIAEMIRKDVESRRIPRTPKNGVVTVSIGVCLKAGALPTESEAIGIADKALYRAKAEGKNRIICI